METVTLYTRQNDKTLAQLERDGRIVNERLYVRLHFGDCADLFLESYEWFAREASKRVPRPDDGRLSIWCSISRENCLKAIEGTVVYVLEVPKDQVIYFDEAKWDHVLNRIYIPPPTRPISKSWESPTASSSSRAATPGCTRRRWSASGRAGSGCLPSTTGGSSTSAAISGRSGRSG